MINQKLACDVLVVGGGPAGLKTAETVAAAGYSVILVEREKEIGLPVHTSGATSIEVMTQFGIPRDLYHEFHRIRMCSQGEQATFDSGVPIGCVIDVHRTYKFLATEAETKGVVILTGVQAESPIIHDDYVMGCTVSDKQSGRYDIGSKIVIDASGYRAGVAKQSGLHAGFSRFGVGSEYELIAPNCCQDEAVLIVGSRFAPSGYAWVFPWGNGRVRLGVGLHHGDVRVDPKERLQELFREAGSFGVDLSEAEITETHYGLIPAEGLATSLVGNGIMAVGDAAGQATLVVGEGIRLSLLAGQAAGRVAASAVASGTFDREALLPYEQEFRSRHTAQLRIGRVINQTIAGYNDAQWDDRVRILRSVPTGLFAKFLQSQFPAGRIVLWIASQPKLWLRLIRYLARRFFVYQRGRPASKVR